MAEGVYRTRVYYRDVDQMGVVYYSRYLEYFEAARTELLRRIGVQVPDIEARGYYLPVVASHCEYPGSARFDDLLEITCRLDQFTGARMRIEYRINCENKLIVSGYTEHCFTNRNQRPVRPPHFFKEALTNAQ